MKNIHTQMIPAEMLEKANQKIDELLGVLSPYLLSLTPNERMSMLKMGEKNLSFVEKSGELAANNPSLRPAYLDMDEFNIDVVDALGLRTLLNKLQQVTTSVDDTMMIAGGEAYNAALVFYASVKTAAEKNVPGAKTVYAELKKRFPGRGKAQNQEEQQTPENQ